jgi:hypothetical protein
MGMWFSSPNKIFDEQTSNVERAKVEQTKEEGRAPESKPVINTVMIRHRPTCLSTELNVGFAEAQEIHNTNDKNTT